MSFFIIKAAISRFFSPEEVQSQLYDYSRLGRLDHQYFGFESFCNEGKGQKSQYSRCMASFVVGEPLSSISAVVSGLLSISMVFISPTPLPRSP